MNQIAITVIEMFVSLVVESVILAGIFTWLANKANEKQENHLRVEIIRIEKMISYHSQELKREMQNTKRDLLGQIKESANEKPTE